MEEKVKDGGDAIQLELPEGTETLGDYRNDGSNRIRLFRRPIRDAAHSITENGIPCDADCVARIVLIHELAHSVSHLGRNQDRGRWDGFYLAESEPKEHVAQVATCLFLLQGGCNAELAVFKEMSDHSPLKYRSWETFLSDLRGKSLTNLICTFQENLRLMRKIPPMDKAGVFDE